MGDLGKSIVPVADFSLAQAVEAAREFIAASKAPSTLRAYASAWRAFRSWCADQGSINCLPASPAAVATYISAMASTVPPFTLQTIRCHLPAITHFHRQERLDNPADDPVVRDALAGIARKIGSNPSPNALPPTCG